MAYIRNPEIAYCIVQAERHRQGVWADLTDRQTRGIQSVIADDQRGRLDKQDVLERLHEIARDGTQPATVRPRQGGECPTCGRTVPLLIDGLWLTAHCRKGSYDIPCHEGGK